MRIYLDTSVISYLNQEDVPEKMEQTQEFWNILKTGKYEIIISELVLTEINQCKKPKESILKNYLAQINYKTIKITNTIKKIANEIIDEKILTNKSITDCIHIASAIVSNCNAIISWNFKHIVNIKTVEGIRKIILNNKYNNIEIYAPYVLLDREEVKKWENQK